MTIYLRDASTYNRFIDNEATSISWLDLNDAGEIPCVPTP